MDEKVLELKENVLKAKTRRDAAARGLRDLTKDITRALTWSGASSVALTVVKEAFIGIATSLIGIGIARSIQNSVRLARWFKQGSAGAKLLLHNAQRIGSLTADWLVNGTRGDLRGALLGSVADLAKSDRAGAVLALCLATSDSALEQAAKLEASLRAKGPAQPPPKLDPVPRMYGQQKHFDVVWKRYCDYAVEHHVWSRCYDLHEQLLEIYLAETFYPDPLHPVQALQTLEEAVEKHKTGDDSAYLEWMGAKVEELVEDLRVHGMPTRKPYTGEGPFARLALIFEFLDERSRNKLIHLFHVYNARHGWGWYDGMYDWWSKEGRAEFRELLKFADHRFRREGPRPPFPLDDDEATSGE